MVFSIIVGVTGLVLGGQFCGSLQVKPDGFVLDNRYWSWSAGQDVVHFGSLRSIRFRTVRDSRSRTVMTCVNARGGQQHFDMSSLLKAAVPEIVPLAKKQGVKVDNEP
jgi:hypothetical protein